jgi:Reverse transcriptase (RNA-dependent DNA polymerase)
VPRQSGLNGPALQPESGNTQGSLLSPTLFNIQVDAVVRHWLTLTIDNNRVTQQGIGVHVAKKLPLFYADDGLIGTISSQWLTNAFTVLVQLFRQTGLETNFTKTVLMINQPTLHVPNISHTAYHRRTTGEGATYQERQKIPVKCPECGATVQLKSLRRHRSRLHSIDEPTNKTTGRDPPHRSRTANTPYRISIPKGQRCKCPGHFTTPAGM